MDKTHTEKCKANGINQANGEKVIIPTHCDCDGYHTFDELYNHRITLYIALCRMDFKYYAQVIEQTVEDGGYDNIWRSKRHSDGELCFGTGTQFILGIGKRVGEQISYHIPIERWEETNFADTLEKAPEWDGHTSDDVLERIKLI